MLFFSTTSVAALKRGGKHFVLLAIDLAASVAAIAIAILVALPRLGASDNWAAWLVAIPPILASGALIFYFLGLSRRFWRFVSIVDLALIVFAGSLHTLALFFILSATLGIGEAPAAFFLIQCFISVSLMGLARGLRRFGPQAVNLANRLLRGETSGDEPPALIAGAPDAVAFVLRKRELGLIKGFKPVGVLDDGEIDLRRKLHGVPILGGLQALNYVVNERKDRPNAPRTLVIAAAGGDASDAKYISLASRATGLGLNVVRASFSGSSSEAKVELREFDLSELLGRAPIKFDPEIISRTIGDRSIVVTGAGGSIGSELVRQIASFAPRKIVLIEQCEYNLYQIDLEIRQNFPDVVIAPILCDIRDRSQVMSVFLEHQPQMVFHAAALKHVPLVELNPCPAAATNLLGTRNIADAARKHKSIAMIQVSTDKAVNPVGVMGATKRLGELYCQALDLQSERESGATRFLTVRFGNVLGSSGSVVPLFQRQLRERLPLTVTDPEMTRFFMTIHEAVALILQSAHAAIANNTRRGRIFVLDMGEPIKVIDIAHRMIRLSGLEPGVGATIRIIGARPGEKLFEQLFDKNEQQLPSEIPGVFEAEPAATPMAVLDRLLERLSVAIARGDEMAVRQEIFALIGEERAVADGTKPAGGPTGTSPADAEECSSRAMASIMGAQ